MNISKNQNPQKNLNDNSLKAALLLPYNLHHRSKAATPQKTKLDLRETRLPKLFRKTGPLAAKNITKLAAGKGGEESGGKGEGEEKGEGKRKGNGEERGRGRGKRRRMGEGERESGRKERESERKPLFKLRHLHPRQQRPPPDKSWTRPHPGSRHGRKGRRGERREGRGRGKEGREKERQRGGEGKGKGKEKAKGRRGKGKRRERDFFFEPKNYQGRRRFIWENQRYAPPHTRLG